MHELAVTENILHIAIDHAQKAGATRVATLRLVIGDLSSIIDESVQFYWDIISKDTICEGARLDFRRVPAQLRCHDCRQPYTLANGELTACPRCGGFRVSVAAGEEFRLDSIDVT